MITYDEKFRCPYCRSYVKPRVARKKIGYGGIQERYFCPRCQCTIEVRIVETNEDMRF